MAMALHPPSLAQRAQGQHNLHEQSPGLFYQDTLVGKILAQIRPLGIVYVGALNVRHTCF